MAGYQAFVLKICVLFPELKDPTDSDKVYYNTRNANTQRGGEEAGNLMTKNRNFKVESIL